MNEIICPHCSEKFKIDENSYVNIVRQVHDKEFESNLEKRINEINRVNDKEFPKSKAAKLAEKSLIGVSEKEISKAIDLENAAKIAGIKLLPGETFKDNKMIAQITEDVLQSDLGSAYIYQAIKNRPKKVEALVEKQADAISKMPESQRAVFKMISDTAKTNIKQAKKTRTNKAQNAGYKVADDQDLPAETVLNIIDGINAIRVGQNSPSASK